MKISTLVSLSKKIVMMHGTKKTESEAVEALRTKLVVALSAIKGLAAFRHTAGRDECTSEGGTPFIQVSYTRELSGKYSSELRFQLRDNKFGCAIRMWDAKDGLGSGSQNYEIADNGNLDADVSLDQSATLSQVVKDAVEKALDHQVVLLNQLGLAVGLKKRLLGSDIVIF